MRSQLHFARGLVCLMVGNLVAGAVLLALFLSRVSHEAGRANVGYVPTGLIIAVALTAGLMGLTRERRAANIALGAVMAVSAWGLFEVIYSIV